MLVAFLACGMAAQALTARTMYSAARDDVLPASRLLRSVDRRRSPIGAIAVTTVVGCLGMLVGLRSAAVGTLIAFGTAAIYVSFLLIAVAALVARVRGTWKPAGLVKLGARGARHQRSGRCLARVRDGQHRVATGFDRAPRRAVYQVWAAPLLLAAITLVGLAYLLLARPTAGMKRAAGGGSSG